MQFDVLSAHWNPRSGILHIGTREKGVYRILLGPAIKAMLEE
jgi:murein endopeptidase